MLADGDEVGLEPRGLSLRMLRGGTVEDVDDALLEELRRPGGSGAMVMKPAMLSVE